MKYLGVEVVDKRDCYQSHREEKINLARRMLNMTYSVIAGSCLRMLLGKAYWKNVVLPSVLYASEVVVWKRDELAKLQRIENCVWRQILRPSDYTPVVTLQGEVGCSSVEARDRKIKLKFAKHMMETENRIGRRFVMRAVGGEVRGTRWSRKVGDYLGALEWSWRDLEYNDCKDIGRKVENWELMGWREEVRAKSSLGAYRVRERFGDGRSYDNCWESALLFRARSNTLRL